MRAGGASFNEGETAKTVVARALDELVRVRSGLDHPGLFAMTDHPWTDHFARLTRSEVEAWLIEETETDDIHVVASHWRAASLLEQSRVRAGAHPLYDVAWRVYPSDGERLLAQPLTAECIWKGGWPALARGCDRLAQARSGLKLIATMDDPNSKVGDMTLAEACAFRISAFAPPGDAVMLAFYGSGGADSWRDSAGFDCFSYVTGARSVAPL